MQVLPVQHSPRDLLGELPILGFHGRHAPRDCFAHWLGARDGVPTNAIAISRLAQSDDVMLSGMRDDLIARLAELGMPAQSIAYEEWRSSARKLAKAVNALCRRIRRDKIHAVAVRDLSRFGRTEGLAAANRVLNALATVDGLLVTADHVFRPLPR